MSMTNRLAPVAAQAANLAEVGIAWTDGDGRTVRGTGIRTPDLLPASPTKPETTPNQANPESTDFRV